MKPFKNNMANIEKKILRPRNNQTPKQEETSAAKSPKGVSKRKEMNCTISQNVGVSTRSRRVRNEINYREEDDSGGRGGGGGGGVSTRRRRAGRNIKQEEQEEDSDASWESGGVSTRNQHSEMLNFQENHSPEISAEMTPNDQPYPPVSPIYSIEEDPPIFHPVKNTLAEAKNSLDPSGRNVVLNNSSSLQLPTQPQDGGSTKPNAHSSPLIAPTGSGQSTRLLEKFMRMRSILENDENTLQLLQTLIQNDDQAAYIGSVKSENFVIDVDDDYYSVRMHYGSTLDKIITTHGDIAKDCNFSNMHIRSHFLKMVCSIYEELEGLNILNIDTSAMSRICLEFMELQQANINIKWLEGRIEHIIELTEEVVKENVAGVIEQKGKELELYKGKGALLEEVIKQKEEELELYKGKAALLEEVVIEKEEELDLRMKKIKTVGQSFVHGLC